MSKQANMQAQQAFGEAINTGNLEAIRRVVAPNSVDHDPAPRQVAGPDGYISFFSSFRKSFPDLKVAVEHLTADDDTVALAYTVTGTHKGDFLGIAPTGKSIKARGMQIGRFEDGKLVERWGSSDQLGILKQLGVSPVK